jgi:putative ABC transport system permease protein
MGWIRRLWTTVHRGLFRHAQANRDLDDELRFHLAQETQLLVDRGASPEDAQRAARRAFGSLTLAKETARAVWVWTALEQVCQDLRAGCRLPSKSPGFTVVAVFTLALGIGASNTLFTIVNGTILRGLPVPKPDQIVRFNDAANGQFNVSYRDFEDWRAAAMTFAGLAADARSPMIVGDDGLASESFAGTYTSTRTFGLLGVTPRLGRDFLLEDGQPGAPSVVILGHRVWTSRYGADPGIIGRTIRINGVPSVVVGIMPDRFGFPAAADLWQPLASMPDLVTQRRDARLVQVFGRLADHTTIPQAQSEMNTIVERVSHDHLGPNTTTRVTVSPFTGMLHADGGWASLLGATGFILLIACANVATLILARAAPRSRELSIRASLGASRWRIVRQLLAEHLVLALVAGIAGLGMSLLGVRLFVIAMPQTGQPYWFDYAMDRRVFQFLAGISLGTAVVFGVGPALHVSGTNLNEFLKDGGRSGTAGTGARRQTSALLVAELALTLVLLAAASLSARSFMVLYRADSVLDTSNVLIGSLRLPIQKYPVPELQMAFFARLQERFAAVSTISSATTANAMPYFGAPVWTLTIDGRPVVGRDDPRTVSYVVTGARYFDTLGLRLLRGRAFSDPDGSPGQEVAIVNERFVALYFPSEDPIGHRIRLTNPDTPDQVAPWATIVGLSLGVRQNYGQVLDPVVYVPYRQDPGPSAWLIVRGRSQPEALTSLLREEVRALDPDLVLGNVTSLEDMAAALRLGDRVPMTMFLVFAGIALLLCVVGLYAVTAYGVTQRTREIGVRIALGAQARQVVWLFVRRAVLPLGIGLAIGVGGIFGVAKLMQAFLFQTSATDPATLVAVVALLVVVAMAACVFPARRATRLDPVTALRCD